MLHLEPSSILKFLACDNNEVFVQFTSTAHIPIIFKIQTTAPEKFRVRPRCGLLEPQKSVQVSILLKPEHQLGETPKDKFLILSTLAPMEMDLSTTQHIADVWKQRFVNLNSTGIEQHRLTCTYESDEKLVEESNLNEAAGVKTCNADEMEQLTRHADQMAKQLRFTQVLQYLTLFVLLIVSVAVVFLLRYEMYSGNTKATRAAAVAASTPKSFGARISATLNMDRFKRQPKPPTYH